MTKGSNKSKKPYSWPIFPIFGTKKFKKNPALSRATAHAPLIPCWVSEKTSKIGDIRV